VKNLHINLNNLLLRQDNNETFKIVMLNLEK